MGTHHQLLIDGTITENVKAKGESLCMAWIDVRKAYDSVNQQTLLKLLTLYRVHPLLIQTIATLTRNWAATLIHGNQTISPPISISRVILQGDSLSPLPFLVCINISSVRLAALPLGLTVQAHSNQNHPSDLSTEPTNQPPPKRRRTNQDTAIPNTRDATTPWAGRRFNHLLFVDDYKLYGSIPAERGQLFCEPR